MPDLVKLADEREDIAVVGLQHDDTVEAGRAFADELGISFPLAREDGGLYDRLGLVGLPVTVFVDAEGRVASTFRGVLTPETLDAFVDELGA